MSRTATQAAATLDTPGAGPAPTWQDRVEAADWGSIGTDLDRYGCSLIGPLLVPDEAAAIAALYTDEPRFRATIDMARHHFGEGEYRYFAEPLPEAVTGLKRALYPKLRDRPVQSGRGWSAAPVRHGVSVIRSGQRFTLGLVFHDAA